MRPVITKATPDDAAAIAQLKGRVWPAEAPAPDRIRQALTRPYHAAQVARAADGAVVGFVDGFLTTAANGLQRWEVDLLAVDAAFQGQKIGQQLIAASTQAGHDARAAQARTLVQVENFASQGAFRQNGYRTNGQIYRLMISKQARSAAPAVNPYLIEVHTMNYSGLWLEGDWTGAHLEAAQAERTRRGSEVVGVLIPLRATDLLMEARRLGYTLVEHFQWWLLDLGTPS